jgi:hypothetical protein
VKLLIAGSRTIFDRPLLERSLQTFTAVMLRKVSSITEIVSGKCSLGVDRLGEEWAIRNGVPIKPFPANWVKYPKTGGMRRNEDMAKYCDGAVILWDGKSPGTKNMLMWLKHYKKPYFMDVVLEGKPQDVYDMEQFFE